MGNVTISMVIFHSDVTVYQRVFQSTNQHGTVRSILAAPKSSNAKQLVHHGLEILQHQRHLGASRRGEPQTVRKGEIRWYPLVN